jgi:deoxyribonucleoside regulator
MEKERLRLMVKVCQLYFQEGLNQQSIAVRYGISRSQVSRMITAAKAEGVVEITIRNPFSDESALEKELLERFRLRDVIVVDTTEAESGMADVLLAQAGAAFLENVFNDGDVIGVMAGKSITALAKELKDPQKRNLQFVPLIGGWGSEGADWHANSNVSLMAKNAKGGHWLLHAPAIVSSEDTKQKLMAEPEIEKVLNLSRRANIAVIGIGQISEGATFVQSTNINARELSIIKSEGVVGSICTSFINENGEEMVKDLSNRMLGLSGEEIKNIPQVIAIARGEVKAKAIHASLKGNWLDVLITDMATAKQVLEIEKNMGEK